MKRFIENNLALCVVCFILVSLSLGVFFYKITVLGFPLQPESKGNLWSLEVRLALQANNKPVEARLFLPMALRQMTTYDESFVSRGFGLATEYLDSGNRQAIWTIRRATGLRMLYYRSLIQLSNKATSNPPLPPPQDLGLQEAPENIFPEPVQAAAKALVSRAEERSADAKSLMRQLVASFHAETPESRVVTLLEGDSSANKKVKTVIRLAKMAGIPCQQARVLFFTGESRDAKLMRHILFWEEGQWEIVDPLTGRFGLPANALIWSVGENKLVIFDGAKSLGSRITIKPVPTQALAVAIHQARSQNPNFIRFSLHNLSLETQLVYQVMLLIPLGALIVVVMRNVIGFKALGTFLPVLLTLSFRDTQLLLGTVLLITLVGIGLTIRFLLGPLKLLFVPRVASVLIVVVLLMASLSILTHDLDMDRGLSLALFPLVIVTMAIERMSIVWEEQGAKEALEQGLGSLLVAILCYPAMFNPWTEHLLFAFPELLLFLLAITLLLGRYTGYRLSELFRFRELLKKPEGMK